MHVPVVVEVDYKNTGPQNVVAGTTQDFEFPAPEGWTAVSWGFSTVHPILEFQTLGFFLNDAGKQVFRATVRNPGGVDRQFRFVFMLMKI